MNSDSRHRQVPRRPAHVSVSTESGQADIDGLADARPAVFLLRLSFVIVLAVCLWFTATSRAHARVDPLIMPSAETSRVISASYPLDGDHDVVLLDAFAAATR
ncbi:hypothetical protein [Mycolicibacterium vaccae]|uniref:hypothetical protein n=1 Tax=Mycolicibacterium vaccae TaxID=1810 RepID=UPI003D035B37